MDAMSRNKGKLADAALAPEGVRAALHGVHHAGAGVAAR